MALPNKNNSQWKSIFSDSEELETSQPVSSNKSSSPTTASNDSAKWNSIFDDSTQQHTSQESEPFLDSAKSFGGGLVSGTATLVRGTGELMEAGGEVLASGLNKVTGTEQFKSENPLQAPADYLSDTAENIYN